MVASAGVDWEEGRKREGQVLGELLGMLEPVEREVLLRLYLHEADRGVIEDDATRAGVLGDDESKKSLRSALKSSVLSSASSSSGGIQGTLKGRGSSATKSKRNIGQKSAEEVGKELGLSKNTVFVHASKGLGKLRLAVAKLDQAAKQQQQQQHSLGVIDHEDGLAGGEQQQQQLGQVVRLLAQQRRLLELLAAEGIVASKPSLPSRTVLTEKGAGSSSDSSSSRRANDASSADDALLRGVSSYLAEKQHVPSTGEMWQGLEVGEACHRWQLLHGQGKLSSQVVQVLSGLDGWAWEYAEGSLAPPSRYLFNLRAQQLKDMRDLRQVGREGEVMQPAGTGQGGGLSEQEHQRGKKVQDKFALLGEFVTQQQVLYKLGLLTPQRSRVLESVPGWNWGEKEGAAAGANTANLESRQAEESRVVCEKSEGQLLELSGQVGASIQKQQQSAVLDLSAEAQTKKRRGRPRKTEQQQGQEGQQDRATGCDVGMPAVAAKRGRGRPRKSDYSPEKQLQQQQLQEAVMVLDVASGTRRASSKGKRRGRPSKAQQELEHGQVQQPKQQFVEVSCAQCAEQMGAPAPDSDQQSLQSSLPPFQDRVQSLQTRVERNEGGHGQDGAGDECVGGAVDNRLPDLVEELQRYTLLADACEQQFGSVAEGARELLPAGRWSS
jgi:hypothetical protein